MSEKKDKDLCKKTNANLFLTTTIRPTLIDLNGHSPQTEKLLLGTAIQESRLEYREQIGGGPALGLFQMEPKTHDDIWDNYLKYHKELKENVEKTLSTPDADKHEELKNNDKYAAAMAYVHYKRQAGRKGEVIPTDADGQAKFWKKHCAI